MRPHQILVPFVCVCAVAIVLIVRFPSAVFYAVSSVGSFFAFQLNVYSFKRTRVFWWYVLAMFLAAIVLWQHGLLFVAGLGVAFAGLLIMAIGRTKFRRMQARSRRKVRSLQSSLS